MGSKNSLISKLARNLDATGDITADAIASTVSLGAKIYASRANLPASGNTAGDQAYVTDSNRLYIWNGSGWYNIALLNVAPAISSVTDSDGGTTPFSLSTEGAVTTITITAADSDGDPITYSASADSDFSGLATISQADNVFTVTPLSQDSATTELGTVTFTATDGINVASSGIQTFRLRFLSQYWDETVLSIGTSSTNSLDNSTLIDRSSNARTITNSGTPNQTQFHPYYDYWSVELDGTDDYLRADTALDTLTSASNSWTIECWMWSDRNDTGGGVIPIGVNRASDGYNVLLYRLGSVYIGSSTNNFSSALSQNQWVHVALTYDGSTFKVYHDGTQVYTQSISGFDAAFADCALGIGAEFDAANGGSPGNYYKGYISDFRISNIVRYTTAFSRPTEKLTSDGNTLLLTAGSNQFKDLSSSGHTITMVGGAKISNSNPYGQDSEFLPAENKGSIYSATKNANNATFTSSSALAGDFTIEGWFYAESVDASYTTLWSNGGTSHNSTISLSVGDAGLYHRLYISTLQRPSTSFTNGWMISTNKYALVGRWNHIAIVRDVGKIYFYLNGVKQYMAEWTSQSYVLEFITNTTAMDGNFNVGGLQGWTSDFKVTSSAVYTSDFTLPTAPVGPTDADTYLPFDNAGIYDKTGNQTLTLVGNTITSTTQTKFADTAMYFDGTGDYITTTIPGGLGSGDFTIEGWAYHTSLVNWISWVSSTRGTTGFNVGTDASGDVVWYDQVGGASRKIEVIGQISPNTWYHFAFVRSSGVIKAYLNGTQVGSSYSSTQNYSAEAFGIGDTIGAIGEEMYGYLENVQILKGVAKYTTNFTPPTSTQGRTYQAES